VIQGEKLFDMVVRMEPQYRSNARDIAICLVPAPAGQQIPLSNLPTQGASGASFIYRENNSRYIGFSFPWKAAISKVSWSKASRTSPKSCQDAEGYRMEWGGEYSELLEAKSQLYIIGPWPFSDSS